jgi:signal transduction histidine kinase
LAAQVLCASLPAVAASPNDSTDRILVINSQPYTTEWFNSLNDSFVAEINRLQASELKFSYEYIDGNIANDPAVAATVIEFLKQKYQWRQFRLIIAVMPSGCKFLLEHGDKFAQGIPQLYVLPSPQQVEKISSHPNVGIVQSTGNAIVGTLKNIKTVLPNVKHLYVVAGVGADDREYMARARRFLEQEKDLFAEVTYLTGLGTTELVHVLSAAPKDSAVMMLTYVANSQGQPVTTVQVLKAVTPLLHIPVFSFYDTVFGSGIVGGNLTSTEAYGETMANVAARMLAGENRFISMTASTRYMYDWRQLKRWEIPESRLPADRQIRFVEYTLWDRYRWQIVGALLLFVLQAALIATLLYYRRRQLQLSQELRQINVQLETKVEERTEALTAANEELMAANEEQRALNEQMIALNETLDDMNHRMAAEISDKEQMSATLAEANQKLKELDRMKSMFIASMSHELRTPLNSIIGFTGITLQEMSGPLNEEQKDNLSRVKRSANHLLALITDVIDISKIESGRVDSFPQAFSLNELVREAVDTIRSQVEDKGMSLEVPVSADVAMFTDRRRLLQCLINLLSNAVKYSEAGKITVAIRPLGEQVEIAVRDSGIGIAEADLPKLFEPFERVKSHLQVKAGGTGLGLYLTKKLVTEVLHGEVDVRSIQGEGSTFTIRIPPQVEEGREA